MCTDQCPAPSGGLEWACKYRFMYGINYAWHSFAADFGGIPQWNQPGVSAAASVHSTKLADMKAHGVSVIRWWVMPDFRSAAVTFDASDNPTGLGGTAIADLQKALELAQQHDVYLMLCLFSFDGFRPTGDEAGIRVRGLRPIAVDAAKRKMLMDNVVRPFARAAEASPHKSRLVAWDVINEPEWAMTGPSPYGDEAYDPSAELESVTHAQMETFVKDTIVALRAESRAMVTVGGAAMKWKKAWSRTDVDFYQFHIYDWVNMYWPYNRSPADYMVNDKPVVMGEFPVAGLTAANYGNLLSSFYATGYSGAMGWHYAEATPQQMDAVKAFADSHPCETKY
jgi:hypothetical protein